MPCAALDSACRRFVVRVHLDSSIELLEVTGPPGQSLHHTLSASHSGYSTHSITQATLGTLVSLSTLADTQVEATSSHYVAW
jgi:hypothetical protein